MATDNEIIAQFKVEGLTEYKSALAESVRATSTVNADLKKMEQAIKTATNPKDVQRLTSELEAMKVAVTASENAFESSRAELTKLKNEAAGFATVLAQMKNEGKQGTQTFRDLQKQFETTKGQAGKLTKQIKDINQEIGSLGSDTRGIDTAVRGLSLMANTAQVSVGITALLGKEHKSLEQGLLKLNGVMAAANGIQQIGNEITRQDSVFKLASAKATQLWTGYIGAATGALRIFKVAMATLGIGLVVIAIGELVANWDKLKTAIFGATVSLEDYNKEAERRLNKQKENEDFLESEIKYLLARGEITKQEANDRLKINKSKNLKEETKEYQKQLDVLAKLEKNQFVKSKLTGYISPALAKERALQIEVQKEIVKTQKKALYDTYTELTDFELSLIEKKKKEINKNIEESGEGVEIPIVDIELDIPEEVLRDRFRELNKLIEDANAELVNEMTINPNSTSLEPLAAKVRDLQKELDKAKKLYDDLINPKGGAEWVKDAPIIPQPDNGEVDFKPKGKTFFESIFGTAKENETAMEKQMRMAKGALKIAEQISQYTAQIANIAMQSIGQKADNELANLDEKKKRGLISEKDYEKKASEIKTEAAKKKRKAEIAMATAQIPVAVLSAYIAGLQVGGPAAPIVAAVMAGIAGAFGIAQVALISSAPLPKFKKGGSVAKRLGLIKGAKHEQGGVPIEVEGDEFVMKSEATKKYGVKMLDDINNLKFNPVLASSSKLQSKRTQDYRLYENLSTISSYLKQGYKIDAKGNEILKEISGKIQTQRVYV